MLTQDTPSGQLVLVPAMGARSCPPWSRIQALEITAEIGALAGVRASTAQGQIGDMMADMLARKSTSVEASISG